MHSRLQRKPAAVVGPSNVGTGLRAGAFVRLPKLSALRCFVQLLGEMGLQARGPVACDDSVWDISNAARLGKTEVPPQSRVSGKCY